MLPAQNRLHNSREFGAVVRRRRGIGRDDVVVYLRQTTDSGSERTAPSGVEGGREPAVDTAPRFGFIVAKSVGSSVDRHRVTRRLRHVCRSLISELPDNVDIVIRALPGASSATSAVLDRQIRSALTRLRVLSVPSTPVGRTGERSVGPVVTR
ncbi:ribonuclease P protein component [Millisia brevis]|uniref:ribonuclease P protein component n=1 Tax=Millisia brevis TaxID=264148 RepID=UPI000A026FB5|nr:ribonuclease P protein component [Millisia brevis]